MPSLTLQPTHKAVSTYYDSLAKFATLRVVHEGAVRSAFQELLEHCARKLDWKLVPEYPIKRKGQAAAKVDGALIDHYGLSHGFWEAKDSADDLEKEIKNKFAIGYPKQNILFWQPDCAVLYQNGERFYKADLAKPEDLVHILRLFLEFAPPAIADWEKAVEEFRDKVPQIGASLKKLIETERQANRKFISAFDDFCSLCRGSLNPNISTEAVEEMIIQHILTERIFRKIFDVADFIQRNVIAQEIEKVISALTSRSFSRDGFSKGLEHFYGAIENAAATITDFHDKQTFLNTVYERFFQGFCVKVADSHGIVYTPQSLVDFMVASVEHVLENEFKTSLGDPDVHILDPFTGTGNFIVNIMRNIPKAALPHKYANELHCNEIMLLPYYVASMNIEHAYLEATGKYAPFEGICLVDTFQTAENQQAELGFFNEKNSARVKRQKNAPIRVIIGNPPYNAWQQDENDKNKNRKYPDLDHRIRVTYSDDSRATLKNTMGDPFIKAFRWASDRIGDNGVVCFVTNNAFMQGVAGDGIGSHIAKDFDVVYHFDLKGNARTTGERRRKEGGNVFSDQIRVGIGITLLVRTRAQRSASVIRIFRVPEYMKAPAKQQLLGKFRSVDAVPWKEIAPDRHFNWITEGLENDFDDFLPIGSKDAKHTDSMPAVFRTYSNGVKSNNDEFVFDFDPEVLAARAKHMVRAYMTELARWEKAGRPKDVERFIVVDPSVLKWIRRTKKSLARGQEVTFELGKIRRSVYRPFSRRFLYMERVFNEDIYQFDEIFPTTATENENRIICTVTEQQIPFSSQIANCIPCHHFGGRQTQCFPLFVYSGDGGERRDNITPKALMLFQTFYADNTITRTDIFHYVYGILHHAFYRSRYAENLKRKLPRIPFVGVAIGATNVNFFPMSIVGQKRGDAKPVHSPKASAKIFRAIADAGRRLANLHVNYELAKEFQLARKENKGAQLDWRVQAMKLTKDKSSLIYNEFLTLNGIPPEAFDYGLGNRSALEWVIDQYRVTRDVRGQIISDPNRLDDEQYIVRLVGQVIAV